MNYTQFLSSSNNVAPVYVVSGDSFLAEDVVKKILEDASTTGVISKEQLALVILYKQECNQDKSIIKDVLNNSEMVLKFIEGIFK